MISGGFQLFLFEKPTRNVVALAAPSRSLSFMKYRALRILAMRKSVYNEHRWPQKRRGKRHLTREVLLDRFNSVNVMISGL